MNENKVTPTGCVTVEHATKQVAMMAERLGLMHLCYAEALVNELGYEKGREIALKAIKQYGIAVGRAAREAALREGLSPDPRNYGKGTSRDLPEFGVHEGAEVYEVDGERFVRTYGCNLAKVWREKGNDRLGRLYCYMDVAKYMAFNPGYKLAHIRCVADGDSCCEFKLVPTTPEEQALFASDNPNWDVLDKV